MKEKCFKKINKENIIFIFIAAVVAIVCLFSQGNDIGIDNIFYLLYGVFFAAALTLFNSDNCVLAGITGILSVVAFLTQIVIEHVNNNSLLLWPFNLIILLIMFIILVFRKDNKLRPLGTKELALLLLAFIIISIVATLIISRPPLLNKLPKLFNNNFQFDAAASRLQLLIASSAVVSSIFALMSFIFKVNEMWIFLLISNICQLFEFSSLIYMPPFKLEMNSVNVWFPVLYIIICLIAVNRKIIRNEKE